VFIGNFLGFTNKHVLYYLVKYKGISLNLAFKFLFIGKYLEFIKLKKLKFIYF